MNILLLCNKSPWPPHEGGPIAMNAMAEGLINAGHTVKILAINSNKYSIALSSIPESYRAKTRIEYVYIDLSVRPWPALLNLVSRKSYHVERFITDDFRQALMAILRNEKFNIIQFETLFTTPYLDEIKMFSDAKLILRAHNIEHLIWERMAKGTFNPFKKYYLTHLASTLKKYELNTIRKVDGIVAITAKDAAFFRQHAGEIKVTDIPFGINNINEANPGKKSGYPTRRTGIFHLGSMNWLPNQEGIRWFINKVWPLVRKQLPDLEFHLAGREMPDWLRNCTAPGIVIDGEVPDAKAYMESFSVMVVPLFSGSGIRIKIIEGMLAGCAIVTTRVGAEGIDYTDGENLMIAEDATTFAEKISELILQPSLALQTGSNGRQLVMKSHNNAVLMQKLTDFYRVIQH